MPLCRLTRPDDTTRDCLRSRRHLAAAGSQPGCFCFLSSVHVDCTCRVELRVQTGNTCTCYRVSITVYCMFITCNRLFKVAHLETVKFCCAGWRIPMMKRWIVSDGGDIGQQRDHGRQLDSQLGWVFFFAPFFLSSVLMECTCKLEIRCRLGTLLAAGRRLLCPASRTVKRRFTFCPSGCSPPELPNSQTLTSAPCPNRLTGAPAM